MDDLCKVGGAGAIQLSAGSKWVTKHGYANRVEHGSKPAYACTFSTSAKLVSTPTLADDSPAMTATAPASGIGLVYAMSRCPLGHFFCKEKRPNRFPGTPRRKLSSERVEKRWFPDGFPEQPEILTGSALSPEQSRWKRAEQWTPQKCPPQYSLSHSWLSTPIMSRRICCTSDAPHTRANSGRLRTHFD